MSLLGLHGVTQAASSRKRLSPAQVISHNIDTAGVPIPANFSLLVHSSSSHMFIHGSTGGDAGWNLRRGSSDTPSFSEGVLTVLVKASPR